MDAVALEAVAVAGCAALAIAGRQRSAPLPRRAPAIPSARRLIRALPRRHQRRALSIADLAGEILARHREGSFEAFTAAEMLRTYLPETISAFLSVPPGYRRGRRAGRPSADDELRQQFETLYRGLANIAEADAAAGISRMSTNGTFLDERFGPAPAQRPVSPGRALQREMGDLLAERFSRFIGR